MDKPALFFHDIYLYWHGIFMAGAIVLTVCAALLISRRFQRGKAAAIFDTALLALPFGFLLSRLLYCISNFEEFAHITDVFRFSEGGYGLYGAILGTFLAAVTLHARRGGFPLGAVCDSLAAGGALGIAAGRLAAFVSYDNIGIVITDPRKQYLPLSIFDPSTGQWVLATFNMEAAAELVIFAVLVLFFGLHHDEQKGIRGQNGDIALLFLMLHGAAEVVFDSMQMDALRVPGNSFVRIQQIVGALCLAAVMTVFVVRSVRRNGFRLYHLLALAVFWGMIGVAAYMEFDRISDTNYFRNHGMMLIAMICASVIGTAVYTTTTEPSADSAKSQ